MANKEILLLQPVDGLGGEGEQVKVRAGYARNFLLPRKIAVPITRANRKQVEALRKRRAERESKELAGAKDLADRLKSLHIAIAVKTGEGGRMFGAVTAADLHEKITAAGVPVERKKVHLNPPVKTLGKHSVEIRLHADVKVELEFEVVSENPIIEATPAPEHHRGRAERPDRVVTPDKPSVVAAEAAAAAAPEKSARKPKRKGETGE